jgi:photosystem II stability/assembly factor-like uncharacterized protein
MPSRPRRVLPLAFALIAVPVLVAPVVPQGQAERDRVINASDDPLLSAFRFRSIGPASMGGRIDDVEAAPSDPSIIYIGYSNSGVWKSENNGTTFTPVFDESPTASIGDLAIHPTNPDIVYVGTGEANNRQTSSFGDGMYKTTDGGKTFQHIGLRETQTIARVVIDPKNPETVYVAATGHLFGPNKERGVYKTTDGGRTWNNVKFIDEDTGFTDLAMDPANSNILYAASYQRRRLGCCFNGGGPGSGIWKTTDAGRTWTKLTGNGLPPGTYGRIALDVSRSNPNVVYVQVDAGEVGLPRTTAPNDPAANTEATPVNPAAAPGSPGAAQPPAAQTPQQATPGAAAPGRGGRGGPQYNWCNNAGPGRGFGRGRGGEQPPGPPPAAPALEVRSGGVFRSENKGATWTHVSNCNARPMYFSQVRVDPTNDRTVYVAGLPWAKSLDGGRTFATLDNAGGHASPGHVDQHAMWIDPKNPKHLLIGNDGGFNVSWDQGRTWDFVNTMATSLAYWVSADMRRPYYVYTGLQDNGSWGGPSATRTGDGILNSDWFGIGGGDGFQTAVDPTDHTVVYTESQNGSTNRYDLRTGRAQSIRPVGRGRAGRGGRGVQQPALPATPATAAAQPPAAQQAGRGGRGGSPNVLNSTESDDPYRFNWNTPFQLSPHDANVIWLGGSRLFKSTTRGDTWVASGDLTRRVDRNTIAIMGVPGDRSMLSKNDGVTAFSTIISLSESPVAPGVVWVGTDDGLVQVTRDGGATFADVSQGLSGLPADHMYWVSRIDASHFDPATAYVAVDGHRSDDLKPYVFVTRDYGKTWQAVTGNLPPYGNVQVIREDPVNRNLLYVGTEFGLFASIDGGRRWQKFMNNLPTARVDDILVHPRDHDLIVATHARGIWIADDITPLQQAGDPSALGDAVLFDMRPAVAYITDRQQGQYTGGQKYFAGENPPRGAAINYFLKSAPSGAVTITVADTAGRTIRTIEGTTRAGLNRVMWNLQPGPPPGQEGRGGGGGRGGFGAGVDPGTYLVTLSMGDRRVTKPLTVLQDVWLRER